MKRYYLSLLVLLMASVSYGQEGWTWSVLPSMPEPVSNNSVTQGYSGDTLCIYSFTGIDESKLFSGIHLKSWKYNTISQEWSNIPDVPDFQGKIAAAASTINNKIYVIGGYHVNADNTEISSEKTHVFDPEINSWIEDGADIPVAIDDHVQAVWRDSLLFVVTGWSNNGNVEDVQIYNPELDLWSEGTPVPNGSYRVFGGAGTITGDSLFYYGGVTSGTFSTQGKLRRGVINPNNPTEIEWTNLGNSPGDKGYRCGAIHYQDRIYFVGGSGDGYNYDGISYATNQGVAPLTRILTWWSEQGFWNEGLGAPYGVMDLRGLSQISENQWIICGGMGENQEVSEAVYLLTLNEDFGVSLGELEVALPLDIFYSNKNLIISGDIIEKGWTIEVYDLSGKLIVQKKLSTLYNSIHFNRTSSSYVVNIFDEDYNIVQTTRVIQP